MRKFKVTFRVGGIADKISTIFVNEEHIRNQNFTNIISIQEMEHPVCQRCGEMALVSFSLMFEEDEMEWEHNGRKYVGHNLRDMATGSYRYTAMQTFCAECGQIQGEFPTNIHGVIVTKDSPRYPYKKK